MSSSNLCAALDAVPAALRERPQWVVWKADYSRTRMGKIPYSPVTGRRASSTTRGDWTTFERACGYASRGDWGGVSYVLDADDPYVGLDLDDCRDAEGTLSAQAAGIVEALASYTEVSPSGTGLRLWIRAALPPGRRRTHTIEMYDRARAFTVTGQHLPGTPLRVEERSDRLAALHRTLFPPEAPLAPLAPPSGGVSVREALERLSPRMGALLAGGGHQGYPSHSEADAAVACALAHAGLDAVAVAGVLAASTRGAEHQARKHGSEQAERGYWMRTATSAARLAGVRVEAEPAFVPRHKLADIVSAAGVLLRVRQGSPFAAGRCPFCQTPAALWVHRERPVWGCRTCRVKGDAGAFLARMTTRTEAA